MVAIFLRSPWAGLTDGSGKLRRGCIRSLGAAPAHKPPAQDRERNRSANDNNKDERQHYRHAKDIMVCPQAMGIAWTTEGVKINHCKFTKRQKCQQNHGPDAHQRPWWRGVLALAGFGLALGLALGVKGLGGVFSILARTASRELSGGLGMGVSYGATKAKLKPTKLPKTVLSAMGTIVRAFAEIDDMVNLHICNLGEVKEGMAAILLGRTPISAKLKIAAYLAQLRGVLKFHNSLFDAEFRELLKVRNVVAHGVLLGKTVPGNRFAFLTDGQLEPSDLKLTRETVSIGASDFKAYAIQASVAAAAIEKALKLEALREKRFQQFLRPHRKSQPKGHTGKRQ